MQNMFQFHLVRLKVRGLNEENEKLKKFQFHLVRLKVLLACITAPIVFSFNSI